MSVGSIKPELFADFLGPVVENSFEIAGNGEAIGETPSGPRGSA